MLIIFQGGAAITRVSKSAAKSKRKLISLVRLFFLYLIFLFPFLHIMLYLLVSDAAGPLYEDKAKASTKREKQFTKEVDVNAKSA